MTYFIEDKEFEELTKYFNLLQNVEYSRPGVNACREIAGMGETILKEIKENVIGEEPKEVEEIPFDGIGHA